MKDIEFVKPSGIFTNYIYKAIPLAFDESMSYYEVPAGLLAYLKNTILPAMNNNAEATLEIQNRISELEDYVNHYFDNLDVQEEINNKLDDMAESGELAGIIAQFLSLSVVFGYNTLSDMSEAENLIEGSICKVLGQSSYNDGKGAFYIIRDLEESDVIDGFNLVAVYDDSLVAERLFDYNITQLQSAVNGINDELDIMNIEDTLFLGDSYADGTTYESGSLQHVDSWCENLRKLMGLTSGHYFILSQGGAGFSHQAPNGKRFIDLLQDNIGSITNKNKIKNVIVCAGYNDYDQSYSDIYDKVSAFYTYCKSQFPNAKLYIGMIGGNSVDSNDGATIRNYLNNKVLKAFVDSADFGVTYLSGVENFSHDFFMFDPQGNHPTENGYKLVAKMIYNSLTGGYGNIYQEPQNSTLTLADNISTVTISGDIKNGTKSIYMGNIILNDVTIQINSSKVTIIPANHNNYVCKPSVTGRLEIPCDIWYKDSSNNDNFCTGKLQFNADGSVNIDSTYFAIMGGTIKNLAVYPVTITASTLMS